MTISVRAVYEDGVLRPLRPLPFLEGTLVNLCVSDASVVVETIVNTIVPDPFPGALTPEKEDYIRRLNATKLIQEMLAVMATAPISPDDDENYDIEEALNRNREITGFRMPDSESAVEKAR